MTSPEVKLWEQLKNKQLLGVKFRRQHSIRNYIVDFYAPSKKLAIEIDGETHFEQGSRSKDIARDKSLKAINITTIRYTNYQINTNLEGVLQDITTHL